MVALQMTMQCLRRKIQIFGKRHRSYVEQLEDALLIYKITGDRRQQKKYLIKLRDLNLQLYGLSHQGYQLFKSILNCVNKEIKLEKKRI